VQAGGSGPAKPGRSVALRRFEKARTGGGPESVQTGAKNFFAFSEKSFA